MKTSSDLAKPIGILGGTFDPVHQGHLRIADEIQHTYDLAEIRFIPCWQPVHRKQPMATPQQRLAMLTLALKNHPTLIADDCEMERQGPSYTIDTLEIVRQKYPRSPLCLILGVDAWADFATWHRYKAILDLAHLIVVMRPGYTLPDTGKMAELFKQHATLDHSLLHTTLAGSILCHSATLVPISATTIRDQIAKGENPRALLPESVYDYIVAHHLYSEKK